MKLLFDIGGTNMRFAISEDLQNIHDKVILPTPQDYSEGLVSIKNCVNDLKKNDQLLAAAGGVAAVFDESKELILRAPHLKDWQDKNFKHDLSELLGVEVLLENDTDLAGLGESVYGAGKGYRIVAYFTLSTGIGGSRIIDQKIDVFSTGFEPGHQIIDVDGSVCPECKAFEDSTGIGHWEALCSGAAIKRRYGRSPQEIHDDHVWDHILEMIAAGLNNSIVHWSPDVVVLGGGLMNSEYLEVDRIHHRLSEVLHIFPNIPEIKKCELNDFSAVYGAMQLLEN